MVSDTASDYVTSIKFDRSTFLTVFSLLFTQYPCTTNFCNPYRTGPKKRGRRLRMKSVDLLRLALYYVKSSSRRYALCAVFGKVPTSVTEWARYITEVLCNMCVKKKDSVLQVSLPKPEKMKESSALLQISKPDGELFENSFGIVDSGRLLYPNYAHANT